jgi:hypothetical protein
VDDLLAGLGDLLGPWACLADPATTDRLGRIERGHRIVGIFDGNTLVNQYQLVAQFRSLARNFLRRQPHRADLEPLYDLRRGLPALDPGRLSLLSRHGSTVLGTMPEAAAELAEAARDNPALAGAAECARRLTDVTEQLHDRFRDRAETIAGAGEESFADAQAYALCFAGAACIGLWRHNHEAAGAGRTGGLWRDGLWLHAALTRLLDRLAAGGAPGLSGTRPTPPDELFDRMLAHLNAQYEEGDLFSLLPCRTAEGPPC